MEGHLRDDKIQIQKLALHFPTGLGPSAFGLNPPPPCPAVLSLSMEVEDRVIPSCVGDDTMGGLGINYSSVSKSIIHLSSSRTWNGPEELIRGIASLIKDLKVVRDLKIRLELPKASLVAEGVAYTFETYKTVGRWVEEDHAWGCEVRAVKVYTIVGLHPHEREKKQMLELDVGVEGYGEGWNHRSFADDVYEWTERSSFGTIEALVDGLAKYLLLDSKGLANSANPVLTVALRKPAALPFAIPGVTIHRRRSDYNDVAGPSRTGSLAEREITSRETVYIALGSNIGDRIGHIRRAVDELDGVAGVKVKRTSRLYESEPMYVEDQDRFINGVIQIETNLQPIEVLRALKRIERSVGRTKTFRNGPRVVDLDLLVYGDQAVTVGKVGDEEDEDGVGWLEVPHPRIREREFVLRPMADIAPELVIFKDQKPVTELLDQLLVHTKPSLAPIIPFPYPALPVRLDSTPLIMQIFNATPDSFSDGDAAHLDPQIALKSIEKMLDTPFPPHILDIGGMSTRPGSSPCTEEEEINRVVPLIELIRASSNDRMRNIAISIDTYRANVACKAIEAGASCINDVRGGEEEGMREVMSKMNVPVVIMHSRGDSITMGNKDMQDYATQGGVVAGVKRELGYRVRMALEAGVKDWNIILDPGLGFAKSQEDNLKLIRHVGELNKEGALAGYPVLVGGSRKGFVGNVVKRGKEEAQQRGYGDAAVVAWCAGQRGEKQRSADVLRVHDGRGMSELLAMWKAIEEA